MTTVNLAPTHNVTDATGTANVTITAATACCGTDPRALLASLREGRSSQNYWIARAMVLSCKGCRAEVFRIDRVA